MGSGLLFNCTGHLHTEDVDLEVVKKREQDPATAPHTNHPNLKYL